MMINNSTHILNTNYHLSLQTIKANQNTTYGARSPVPAILMLLGIHDWRLVEMRLLFLAYVDTQYCIVLFICSAPIPFLRIFIYLDFQFSDIERMRWILFQERALHWISTRRDWRYQMSNQKPQIEEGQTTQ